MRYIVDRVIEEKNNSFHLHILVAFRGHLLFPFSTILYILRSKKISNNQELIQSELLSCPQTQKKITKYIY